MFLQRASAGSGKTFKLAKIYIRNLISHKFTNPDNGKVNYILRTDAELTDAHSHILAITFTNKATNEMKERIVAKLADLASGPRIDASGKLHNPDYLDDFQQELVTPDFRTPTVDDIRHTAKAALKSLLNTYSDFNISTIDAFFQSILRTLTFELDLSDNYHVELNDDFIARIGVDQTLSMINHRNRPGSPEVYEWLAKIITSRLDDGRPWDIFAKNSTSSKSMYNELLLFTKKISSESFKQIKDSIRDYFQKDSRAFIRFYDAMADASTYELRQRRKECLNAIKALEDEFKVYFPAGDINEIFSSGIGSYIKLLKRADSSFNVSKAPGANFNKFVPAQNLGNIPDPVKTKIRGKKSYPSLTEKMTAVGQTAWYWQQRAGYWHSLTSRLHYLGLLNAVMKNIEEFRNDNDIIQLSDTNGIIHEIIGKDDAPFIYERTGNIITNYLIDEFQDTSILQWENLNPLLAESESHDYDNLIIGDAKQSIYRFRNAEPELITSQVEKDFPGTKVWNSPVDNTNWRSARDIVEFNNFLFAELAKHADIAIAVDEQKITSDEQELLKAISKRKLVGPLYANTVQMVHNTNLDGYININFSKDSGVDALPDLLQEILRRGYNQRDIAVLADTNGDCQKIITNLMEANKTNTDNGEYEQIEIISEESLKVNESEAVKLILSVLALVSASNSRPGQNDISMEQFVCLCNYLTTRHPDTDVSILLSEGLSSLDPDDEILQLVESASSYTLPALIELIAGKFLPIDMRNSHSAYISALLDVALDYCENNATDIRSFLKWWDDNGDKITISSPEGINAVQVMTIHKSKGLEFDCVIIPKADWELTPNKEDKEILWVNTKGIIPATPIPINPADIPGYIPVVPSPYLKDPQTGLREVYMEYCDKCRIDQINKAYVAFTRPVRELHIFAPAGDLKKESEKIGRYLYNILHDTSTTLNAKYDSSAMTFTLGEPTTATKQPDSADSAEDIHGYYVNTTLPSIGYITDDDEVDAPDEDAAANEEARRTGLLIHSILSTVRTADDIPRAVKRRVINGTISTSRATELTNRLKEAAQLPEAKEWFAADNKIFSERDICTGSKTRRPDRIILTPGNDLIIVDYKTGDSANADTYKSVMNDYRRIAVKYFESLGVKVNSVKTFLFFISLDTTVRPDIIVPLAQ